MKFILIYILSMERIAILNYWIGKNGNSENYVECIYIHFDSLWRKKNRKSVDRLIANGLGYGVRYDHLISDQMTSRSHGMHLHSMRGDVA